MSARALLLTVALVLATSASARADADIYTLAGSGTSAPTRDGTPAIRAGLPQQVPVSALPGGGFLVADRARVWRVDPQGLIHLVGKAREVAGVAALPGGGFLIADDVADRVFSVGPDGTTTTVAGGGRLERDGVPATQAELGGLGAIAALPGGGFVFADGNPRVRRVGPDGRITTIAGRDDAIADDDPDPRGKRATSVAISARDLAVAPDGSILIADDANARIERIGIDGGLTVAINPPDGERPTNVAALPDGGFVYTTLDRVTRVRPDGSTFVLAGAGPFIRTAPDGLQQRLSGQSGQRADLRYVFDLGATPDGGVLISHGQFDAFDEGGFVDYVAPAAPAALGAAILRDRDRVFTPGGMQEVTVSLTAPATATLSAAGHSVTRELPQGVSKVVLPSPPAARPYRVSLLATSGALRAYDDVRIFPPGWLPTETAALIADDVASDVDHCHRFGAARVDCLTNKPDSDCRSVTVRLAGDRIWWAEYSPCAIRSHPHLAHALRPSRRFGRIDEAALVPAT